jgi:Iap family predicted aminopeptidase
MLDLNVIISERPEGLDLKGTVDGAIEIGVKALLVEAGEPKWFSKTVFGPKESRIPVLKIRKSVVTELEGLAGQHVKINLPLHNSVLSCQSVVGYLPGENANHTIVLSAHYDHLGDDPNGFRFPGAIDNVSGVVTVLGNS